MKLLDLFEYDPKITQAFGKASSEIGQAGSKLKEPLVMTDVQGRVEQEIDKLFHDWTDWFERTRKMVADPNPHVDVKAVFVG